MQTSGLHIQTHAHIHHHPSIKTNKNSLEERQNASSVLDNQGSLGDQIPRQVYSCTPLCPGSIVSGIFGNSNSETINSHHTSVFSRVSLAHTFGLAWEIQLLSPQCGGPGRKCGPCWSERVHLHTQVLPVEFPFSSCPMGPSIGTDLFLTLLIILF